MTRPKSKNEPSLLEYAIILIATALIVMFVMPVKAVKKHGHSIIGLLVALVILAGGGFIVFALGRSFGLW